MLYLSASFRCYITPNRDGSLHYLLLTNNSYINLMLYLYTRQFSYVSVLV